MSASKTEGKGRFLIDRYPRSMDQAIMFEEEVLNIPSPPVILAPKFL